MNIKSYLIISPTCHLESTPKKHDKPKLLTINPNSVIGVFQCTVVFFRLLIAHQNSGHVKDVVLHIFLLYLQV